MLANKKEREENCGRGWSPFMVGFITQKGNFKLPGVMNEEVKRKCLRLRRGWALSFKYVESGNRICALCLMNWNSKRWQ